ncbi:MAG: hypothetical protein WC799_05615 [Desulfobacteraceae bacterium]|jgi:hypothetical protein
MKHDEIYKLLKELAEKLDILFYEKNFRVPGLVVKSGLCRIEGRWHYYMDKHVKLREKTELLAQAISSFPLDSLYIVPVLRDYIEKNKS